MTAPVHPGGDEHPARTMATALHEAGVNTTVSASDNGLLIRVHNRWVPRLLELLAADGPVTAPVHPGGERPGGWVEGIGWVAWLHSLPVGTSYEMVNDVGHTCTFGSNYDDRELADRPVIVIGWRDGTTPQAPTVDSVPVPRADEPDSMATILPTGWKATEFSDDTEWPWWDEGGDAITWVATVYHWPGEYEHWTWELVSPDCEADTYLLSGCEQQDPTPFLRDVVDRLHASASIDLIRAAAGVSSDR